ncbi:hypothetical protein V1478_003496 [Vespula squamosa]|uniref:Uncharacterized protein n=1 Tax=Vespula squamosa TaxID=30214 RepID=A0ABD2BLZ6_VESSQ
MSNSFGTKDGKLYEIPEARTSESASPRENFEFTPDLREISLAGPFLSLGGFRAHGIQFVSESSIKTRKFEINNNTLSDIITVFIKMSNKRKVFGNVAEKYNVAYPDEAFVSASNGLLMYLTILGRHRSPFHGHFSSTPKFVGRKDTRSSDIPRKE